MNISNFEVEIIIFIMSKVKLKNAQFYIFVWIIVSDKNLCIIQNNNYKGFLVYTAFIMLLKTENVLIFFFFELKYYYEFTSMWII